MPRGRVKPVYFSESFGIQQANAAAAAAHAVAEAARQKAAEAQDQLRLDALRLAHEQAEHERALSERTQRDDDLMRAQFENKLAESNVVNVEAIEDDAENAVHASQMAEMAEKSERLTNPVPELDTDAMAAEMAALQVRIQNVLDTDIASATA